MTFSDIAGGLRDHGGAITKWSIALISALVGAGIFLGSMKSNLAALNDGFQEIKLEQRRLNEIVHPLPERIGKLEEGGKGNNKLLREIKDIVEVRASVPKNSAPARRP